MSLTVGQDAPDFDVVASDGTRVSLQELRGKKNVVLYFYPKDFTPTCTKETCGFRDMVGSLNGGDVLVVGVSTDNDETHRRFAAEYQLTFPLIADTKKTLAKAYGAIGGLRSLLGITQRVTFVIGKDGKIANVTAAEFSADKHIAEVKATLSRLA